MSPRPEEPLVKWAHSRLREDLLDGQFRVWERLTEARLAAYLSVSRTPIREALRQLEREELVTLDSTGSYRPRAPELGRLSDHYAVRLQLEAMSVSLACSDQADDDAVRVLAEEWQSMVSPTVGDADFVYRDEFFHVGLARAGGNEALAETLASVNDRIRIVRIQDFLEVERIAITISEHSAILRAVQRGNEDQAQSLMKEHISDSASLVADRARQALARMVEPVERPRPRGLARRT